MTTDIVTPSLPGEEVVAFSGRPVRVPGTGSGIFWRTVRYGLLIAFVIVMLMPLYVLVVTSFKNGSDIGVNGQWNLPTSWTLKSWDKAWERLHDSFLRTFELAIPVALISSFVGAANGFVLSRWRFPGADVVFTLILFGMFIPYQAILIPMYQVMKTTGLVGGLDGLILVHVIYGLPITTLIFRSYFASISDELIEASKVDGAGMFRTFFFVALPIAPPAFAVSMIWQFTSSWNDFLFGVLLTSREYWPITVALNNIAGGQTIPFNQSMASALLASIPTLLIYILLGRFFMRGLMAGALKG
jgi:glucose/mannose transport system permease protein